jgi:murein peptide amidase A
VIRRFRLLILAGVHGQEPQSSFILDAISKDFTLVDKEPYQVFSFTEKDFEICSIPRFNEYGLLNNIRGNKSKVDLNRNLPSQNWSKDFSHPDYNPGPKAESEVETQKLVSLIRSFEPNLILSIHTNHFVTEKNPPQVNFDGEFESDGYNLAQKLSKLIDLELTCDIGYSTPGSLGSYAKDLKIPCITLELDDNLDNQASLDRYGKALERFLFRDF